MNSRKLPSFAVFAAIVIIGGAIFYAMSRGPQPGDGSSQVVIERAMASCGINDQCIMVDTKCNFCCDFVAINAKYEAAYAQLFDKTCGAFSVRHCKSCDDKLVARPKCVSGTCQMVKWGEEPASLNFKTTTPAVTAPIAAPVPAPIPAPAPAPVTAPAPSSGFGNAEGAFGEDEPVQTAPPANPADDLYAPITDDMRPYPDKGHVDVIRP